MTTSSERESDGWMRRRSPRNRTLAGKSAPRATVAATAGLLAALLAAGDAEPSAVGGEKLSDDKPAGEEGGAKSDEMKLTVSRGTGEKKKEPSGDSTAFLKDWPFWAIVGGVILAGAATFMIVENHNQKHACGAVYDGGCFGAN